MSPLEAKKRLRTSALIRRRRLAADKRTLFRLCVIHIDVEILHADAVKGGAVLQ